MPTIISALVSFLVYQMVAGFFFSQQGVETMDGLIEGRGLVAFMMLTYGTWVHLFTLWLIAKYLQHTPAQLASFPRLWAEKFDSAALALFWEKLSAWLVLGLPLVGFVFFWERFHRGRAWENAEPPTESVGLWELTQCWHMIECFDDHRYGPELFAKAQSASFVPFTQPLLLMALPTALCMALTVWIIAKMPDRIALRKAAVRLEKS